jgi:hypothetical protein
MKDFQVVSSQPLSLLAFVVVGLVSALCGFFSAIMGLSFAFHGPLPSWVFAIMGLY